MEYNCPIRGCYDRVVEKGICDKHLKRAKRHNIVPERMAGLYLSGCLICGSDLSLQIDHDHKCCPKGGSCGSCVRGVLCASCNNRVGQWETVSEIPVLEKTLRYVQRSERVVWSDVPSVIPTDPWQPQPQTTTGSAGKRADSKGRVSLGMDSAGEYFDIVPIEAGFEARRVPTASTPVRVVRSDSKGRVTLGAAYARKNVRVYPISSRNYRIEVEQC